VGQFESHTHVGGRTLQARPFTEWLQTDRIKRSPEPLLSPHRDASGGWSTPNVFVLQPFQSTLRPKTATRNCACLSAKAILLATAVPQLFTKVRRRLGRN
jgi:hypothetical protein